MLFNKLMRRAGLILAATLILIQAVPYGRSHSNPPVTAEPKWDSPETRALAKRACYDCHSNETTWPWYSRIAPVSWLIQHDVQDGRRHLNFSEWDRPQRRAAQAGRQIEEGEMPPWFFLPMHPEARLSSSEKESLRRGLAAIAAEIPSPPGLQNKSQ